MIQLCLSSIPIVCDLVAIQDSQAGRKIKLHPVCMARVVVHKIDSGAVMYFVISSTPHRLHEIR